MPNQSQTDPNQIFCFKINHFVSTNQHPESSKTLILIRARWYTPGRKVSSKYPVFSLDWCLLSFACSTLNHHRHASCKTRAENQIVANYLHSSRCRPCEEHLIMQPRHRPKQTILLAIIWWYSATCRPVVILYRQLDWLVLGENEQLAFPGMIVWTIRHLNRKAIGLATTKNDKSLKAITESRRPWILHFVPASSASKSKAWPVKSPF